MTFRRLDFLQNLQSKHDCKFYNLEHKAAAASRRASPQQAKAGQKTGKKSRKKYRSGTDQNR